MSKKITKNKFRVKGQDSGGRWINGGDGGGGKTISGNGSGGRYILSGDDSGGRLIIIDGSGTDSGDDKAKY
jgi:hypothetical protein